MASETRYKDKKRYFKQMPKNKYILEAGLKGFFCTCNFREKDCIRESYNLLNEYADVFFTNNKAEDESKIDEDNEDISDALNKEISALKEKTTSKIGMRRFQSVDTGVANCIFIRSNLPDLVGFASFIIEDMIAKKLPKTRYLLRLMPILATCKADIKSIVDSAGLLFDEYFLKEPKTFSILFNKRYSNAVARDDVIKELADLVLLKNSGNKADLKNPDLAIVVEVIKGLCLLSVIPKYYQWKKYNIYELGSESKAEDKPDSVQDDGDSKGEDKVADTRDTIQSGGDSKRSGVTVDKSDSAQDSGPAGVAADALVSVQNDIDPKPEDKASDKVDSIQNGEVTT